MFPKIDRAAFRFCVAQAGVNQRSLAKVVGIHFTTLSSAVTGRIGLSTEMIERIATALGVSVADIVHPETA
jgi:plasmid maintenance system antidote protein VapI